MAALLPDILAFDDSPEGERLRRFDLASGRGLARSLGELRRHRHAQLSVVSGPLSVVSGLVRPLSVVRCPLLVARLTLIEVQQCDERTHRWSVVSVVRSRCQLPMLTRSTMQNATNEPTDAVENVTNEPTTVRKT